MAVVSNGTTIIDAGVGIGVGKMTLIKTLTASSSATLSFVDGTDSVVLDDTYDSYVFKFYNIHPATDNAELQFQGNAAGGSGYNETITSSFWLMQHAEDNSLSNYEYSASRDLAQGTGFHTLSVGVGNDNDQNVGGTLHLFDPSSTTFVKNFSSTTQSSQGSNYSVNSFTAGYFNTTSAIDEIQFKFNSGNIDSGVIKLYGTGG